jgi:hypothetical protein
MVDPVPETYFVWAITAHPHLAVFAGALYAFCAFMLWQFEIPQWMAAIIFVWVVLVFTAIGFAMACMNGSIAIG